MSNLHIAKYIELNKENFKDKDILLTVWCLTYNHISYIKDCFESILAQKTSFKFDILVYDDASTDGTSEVVREYCEKYPDIFHAFIATQNIYQHPKRMDFLKELREKNLHGKYFAICEGDDYWNDTEKLQLQVDFLEKHSDYILTMHNAQKINYSTEQINLMRDNELDHDILTREIILQEKGIWPTASMVGRKDVMLCEPFFFRCGIGDWPMQLYASANGKIRYFNRVMSVYRYMHKGSWSSNIVSDQNKKIIHYAKMVNFLREYDKYTNFQYHDFLIVRQQKFYNGVLDFQDLSHLNRICQQISNQLDEQEVQYCDKLRELFGLLKENEYLSEKLIQLWDRYEKVYIMGTGKFSRILSTKVKKRKMRFEGYVVSDGQALDLDGESMAIPLSKLDYEDGKVLVVVAIGVEYFIEVKEALKERKINNYVFPFIVEESM